MIYILRGAFREDTYHEPWPCLVGYGISLLFAHYSCIAATRLSLLLSEQHVHTKSCVIQALKLPHRPCKACSC